MNNILNRIRRIVENFVFHGLNEPFFQFELPLFTVRVSDWKESSNKPPVYVAKTSVDEEWFELKASSDWQRSNL